MASLSLRGLALATGSLLLSQPATAWNSEQPACPSPFTPFVYKGCYADPVQQGLIFRSTVSSDDMTVEKCNAICKGNSFKYSGLEYYGICYCGNVLHASDADDETKCNTPCAGNPEQTCGGDDYFSVYSDPTFPDAPFTVKDYEDKGCFTDLSDGSRALGFLQDLPSNSMTPAKCLASCQEDGLPYAGLEFGSECWCGTALAANSLPVSIGECSKACSGDLSLLCGAGHRLSLFKAKWGSSKPCGSETYVSTTTPSSTSSKPATSTPSTTTGDSEPPKSTSDEPEPPETTTTWKPEPPKSTTGKPPKPLKTSTTWKPGPPKSTTDKPEPPKTTTGKPEPPKTTTTWKPEPPKSTNDKPEPPRSTTDKPEPPKTIKNESTLVTTTRGTATTDEPPVCTTVVPSHKYCCGSWCSQSLPDFDDNKSCKKARAFCHLQTAACFKYAGWPAAWECHKYKQWCNSVNSYCSSDCSPKKGSCSRHHCLGRNPPKGGPPPVTKTVPCSLGTTSTATPTSTPPVVPSPDGICIQPTDEEYDYGPGNPVGGIDLPIVTCNNDREDHGNGKHFKCYSEPRFDQCHSFERKDLYKACSLACVEQYDQCIEGYAEGGNDKPKKRSLDDKTQGEKDDKDRKDDDDRQDRKGRKDDDDNEKKGHGKDRDGKDHDGKGRDKNDDNDDDKNGGKKNNDKDDKDKKFRKRRCRIQYGDCISENRRADPSSFCLKYDQQ